MGKLHDLKVNADRRAEEATSPKSDKPVEKKKDQ